MKGVSAVGGRGMFTKYTDLFCSSERRESLILKFLMFGTMIKLVALLTLITTLSSECTQSEKKTEFEKIIFHSSGCYGNCPTYHLELNGDKSFRLFAEKVYKKDAEPMSEDFDQSKTGYFTGQASDSSFQKLTSEIKAIGLDTINFAGPKYEDGAQITIILYKNGKRTFLQSAHPAIKTRKLIATLYEICETSNAKRTESKFEIESKK